MKKHYTIIGSEVRMAAFTILVILAMIIRNQEKQTPSMPPETAKPLLTNAPTGSTLTSIQNEIARREYHITYDSAHHALQSPNRLHNLRAYYRPGKLSIQNRIDSTGQNFRMELINEGVYADGKLVAKPESDAVTDHSSDTLTIIHDGFTEEFINNHAGIRQNFIISQAPTHTRQLSVRLSVHGLHARQQDTDHLVFYSGNGGKQTDRLTYSDLKCWDAEGKPLTASIALLGKQIEINVDVANAAYPITIDPIIANGSPANADKTLEINQTSAWLGFSVSTAGDVNGDGYSDVLVGAPKYDNGQADEGAAFLYPGTAGGISLAATVLECNQANAQMGYSVSNAGDINNDGFSDIMVGVPYYDASVSNEGVVMIYKGSVNGLVTNSPYVFKLDQAEANLGISVAMAGDVNGDGYSDMLAGAHQFDNGQSNEGVGVLILGAPNGLGLVTFLECNQANAMMGFAVAGAGDVDGDGFSDVMAGARLYSNGQALEGAAFVFKGSANGLITANPTIIESNQVDARLGHALSSAGDVNGDGFSDVLVGSYAFDHGQTDEGSVFIWYGGGSGIKENVVTNLEMNQPLSQFGWSVASAGDVNGDGFGDVIISANSYDNGQPVEGTAFVFHGSAQGLSTIPNATFEGNQQHAGLGSVSSAGDVNGDGFGDVIIGMPLFDIGTSDEGKVCIFYGSPSGLSQINETTILGTQHEGNFGKSVSSTGDLNNDGFSDIVIGEPGYDIYQEFTDEGRAFIYYGSSQGIDLNPVIVNGALNGFYLGNTVSGGVDVNGDGFDDALIGHPFYSNGQNYEGAVYVLYGSQLKINPANATILQSNIEGAEMGGVCSAGDINGDGFGDIAVGAQWLSNGQYDEGAIFIYYGSANGLTNVPTIIESNVASSNFGNVSSVGDVNGDGYCDLVVGAIGYTHVQVNEGAAYLFLGSSSGISPSHNILIEGNQESAFLGNSVAGAGDINGDGFSDIIVSAHQYDNGQTNEGKAWVYYGNSTLGTRNNLRLYNTDLSTPINHTQFPQTNFGAGLFAKSFTGRNKGKLVWETKPTGQGFSKGSNNRITNSTQSTNSQSSYSNLGTTGLELKNVIDKQGPSTKVRVRVKYDPVLALTGQPYGPWRYLPAYLMGNSTAPVPEEKGGNLSETIEKKAIRLDEGKASELATIYPNPVSNRLNIDFKDNDRVLNLKILTASGSEVYQSTGFRSVVDVSQFSEGTYFLIITKTDGSHTTRQILVRR
ncbi:FG-GAP-like repeat-containing protein [Dyadobacter sp. BHUBP1]|uniref:FG-GAP-like repeat-containing protein n=1 Tax=Dyadobacter sp. BHUBP1 TaxID=3424178 RepID=UPI003D3528F7